MPDPARDRRLRAALAVVLGLAPWLAAGLHQHHHRCVRCAAGQAGNDHHGDPELKRSAETIHSGHCVACRYQRGAKGVEIPSVAVVMIQRLGFAEPPRIAPPPALPLAGVQPRAPPSV